MGSVIKRKTVCGQKCGHGRQHGHPEQGEPRQLGLFHLRQWLSRLRLPIQRNRYHWGSFTWNLNILQDGNYTVYVKYASGSR